MPKNKNDGQLDAKARNTTGIADNNEEIVDLLQVVKPGKGPENHAPAEQEVDFSADLEAMLNSLSEAEKKAAEEEEGITPFPDPTPVDHEVNPDESLDLPGMDEIDKLLEDLGAEDLVELSHKDGVTPAVGTGSGANALHIDAIDELDALPVQNDDSGVGHAPAKKVEIDDDFLHSLPPDPEKPMSLKNHVANAKAKGEKAVEAPVTADNPAPESATDDDTVDIVDFGEAADIDHSLLMEEEPPAAPGKAPQEKARKSDGGGKTAPARDEVDLNELDALVDNVLASAPGPVPASNANPAALEQEFAKLRADIGKIATELRDSQATMRKSLENEAFAALARATSAETGMESLKTYLNEQTVSLTRHTETLGEQAKLIDGQQQSLEALRAELSQSGEAVKKVEASLDADSQRITGVETSLGGQSARLEEMEKSIAGQSSRLEGTEKNLAECGDKLNALEQHLADQSASLPTLSSLPDRLEGVEQSMAAQVNRLKKAENGLAACEGKVKETNGLVADYAKAVQEAVQNLSVLTDRVEAVEQRFAALESQLEKTAAAAAAKVIREEIMALIKGDG